MLPSVVSEVSDCFASGEQDDLYHSVLPANSWGLCFRTAEQGSSPLCNASQVCPLSQQLVCKSCSQGKSLFAGFRVVIQPCREHWGRVGDSRVPLKDFAFDSSHLAPKSYTPTQAQLWQTKPNQTKTNNKAPHHTQRSISFVFRSNGFS